MSIVTISRGSYTHGGKVAEKVAQKLGYECISREVLLETSERYNIPEIKLIRAISAAPSLLERYTFGRENYIAYIRAAILKHLSEDNIVYHGFAGHFFLEDIQHVLKVRIIAHVKYRIECMMEREGVSKEKAERMVQDVDEERQKWSQKLYGFDPWDSRLYDLVINIEKISIEHAADLICNTVSLSPFQTTTESKKKMDRLVREAIKDAERKNRQSPFFEPMREGPWRKED